MAHLVLIVVYLAAAVIEFVGICFTVRLFLRSFDDGTAAVARHPSVARRGPILIAVGVALGLIGNFSAGHLPPPSSATIPVPSSSTDGCDNNDGLFGLCGAGQLH